MTLQAKFRFLLAVFALSVVANMLVSLWCIRIYFDNAVTRFSQHNTIADRTYATRSLIDTYMANLVLYADDTTENERIRLHDQLRRIRHELRILKDQNPNEAVQPIEIQEAFDLFSDGAETYLQLLEAQNRQMAFQYLRNTIEREYAGRLRSLLNQITEEDNYRITQTSASLGQTQEAVTIILAIWAALAVLLCVISIILVRGWILRPMNSLHHAAMEYGRGKLSHRIESPGRDELGQLGTAINHMANSLQEIQKRLVQQERLAALGEVASTLAHNIRNPLAGIRASAQALMEETDPGSTPYELQIQIVDTVDSLNRWIKELLMVNRPLELSCKKLTVLEMINPVLRAQGNNAERRNIALEPDESLSQNLVCVDARHIEQAVQIVVDNALDASSPGSTIEFTCEPESNQWILVHVRDHGTGIPKEVRDRIASPYFTTKPGGTGIGLFMAKKIIETHGGEIRFDSPESGGTIVTLKLPSNDWMGDGNGQNTSDR